jgi:hypothetical protein
LKAVAAALAAVARAMGALEVAGPEAEASAGAMAEARAAGVARVAAADALGLHWGQLVGTMEAAAEAVASATQWEEAAAAAGAVMAPTVGAAMTAEVQEGEMGCHQGARA